MSPTHPAYILLAASAVSTAEQELWKKSFAIFEKGMKTFEAIGDSTNTALLLCNTGRLMRICAQAHCGISGEQNRGEFSPEEALYYNKVSCQSVYSLIPLFYNLSCSNSVFSISPTLGHRILLAGYEAARRPRESPGRVGQCKLGIVHYVFHPGHTSAGLCSTLQESPGTGPFQCQLHTF